MTGPWETDPVLIAPSQFLTPVDGVPPWFASTLADIRALEEVPA